MPLDLDPETRALLERYGFEAPVFNSLRERFVSGALGVDANRIRGQVEPPREGDVLRLPAVDSETRKHLAARGVEAISAVRSAAWCSRVAWRRASAASSKPRCRALRPDVPVAQARRDPSTAERLEARVPAST